MKNISILMVSVLFILGLSSCTSSESVPAPIQSVPSAVVTTPTLITPATTATQSVTKPISHDYHTSYFNAYSGLNDNSVRQYNGLRSG